jgi:hypothetical protein
LGEEKVGKYDQLGRSSRVFGGGGVERRPRRRIREEALVRLTNHRGNPVIFPLNLSGEFFSSSFFFWGKNKRERGKKRSVTTTLESLETTPTRQIIGPLFLFFASIRCVFNSPQIRKVTVHNPQLKSVCTKGARMS